MSKIVYILNGPNLKLLGQREPDIYGRDSLDDIKALCETACKQRGYALAFYQTNIEGELVDHVQEAGAKGAVLLINAAAYTHTSIALYDALKTLTIPVIEVHLSQVAKENHFAKFHTSPVPQREQLAGLAHNHTSWPLGPHWTP